MCVWWEETTQNMVVKWAVMWWLLWCYYTSHVLCEALEWQWRSNCNLLTYCWSEHYYQAVIFYVKPSVGKMWKKRTGWKNQSDLWGEVPVTVWEKNMANIVWWENSGIQYLCDEGMAKYLFLTCEHHVSSLVWLWPKYDIHYMTCVVLFLTMLIKYSNIPDLPPCVWPSTVTPRDICQCYWWEEHVCNITAQPILEYTPAPICLPGKGASRPSQAVTLMMVMSMVPCVCVYYIIILCLLILVVTEPGLQSPQEGWAWSNDIPLPLPGCIPRCIVGRQLGLLLSEIRKNWKIFIPGRIRACRTTNDLIW